MMVLLPTLKVFKKPSLVKKIISVFRDFDEDDYIPAIIEEGNYTSAQGEDFYLKLVLNISL